MTRTLLDLLQVDLLHGERSEPYLAAKRPSAGDEVARGHMKSDEGLF